MLSFFRWTVYSQESCRLRHWHLRHGGRPVKVCKSANNRFKSSFFLFFSTNHTILSICPRCALSARSHPPSKLRSSFIPQTNSYAAQSDVSCERLFFSASFCRASRALSEGHTSAQHEKLLCETWCTEVRSSAQPDTNTCCYVRRMFGVFNDLNRG